jgi:hypothetical protein
LKKDGQHEIDFRNIQPMFCAPSTRLFIPRHDFEGLLEVEELARVEIGESQSFVEAM